MIFAMGLKSTALFIALWFGQTAPPGTSPDIGRILDRGKIVVAMYPDNIMPFNSVDKNGELFGLDVDLARDLAKAMGVKLEFLMDAKTYDEAAELVFARRADVAISVLSPTRTRSLKVSFSVPYVKLYQGMILNRMKIAPVKLGDDPVEWLKKAPEVSIGTWAGSSYVEFAKHDFPNAKLVEYPDFDGAAADTLTGKLHAAIFDDITVLTWMDKHPENLLYVQGKILKDKEDPIAIAVHWEDAHLLRWVNLYLETALRDGTLQSLTDYYIEGDQWKDRLK